MDLKRRKFKKLLSDIDADYSDMVRFSTVRWLNRAACLKRFYDLLSEIEMFAKGKKDISQLGNKTWITDLAFMIDFTTHNSSLNRIQQGNNKFFTIYIALRLPSLKKLCLERCS